MKRITVSVGMYVRAARPHVSMLIAPRPIRHPQSFRRRPRYGYASQKIFRNHSAGAGRLQVLSAGAGAGVGVSVGTGVRQIRATGTLTAGKFKVVVKYRAATADAAGVKTY